MIPLIPNWAKHYDEFWKSVRRRNLWFIKLRYGAVVMMLFLIITAEFILDVTLSDEQEKVLLILTFSILLYNIILHYARRFVKNEPSKFNPLHLSLIQVLLDLYSLTLLVYYTGTIESPLYMLYIFHMIIGSLILPGFVIYSVAFTTIIIFISLTFGEYYNLIPHHAIDGLIISSAYNNFNFVVSFLSIFTFVMIMSVILANRIARQLYRMEQDLFESLVKIQSAETEKQKYMMGIVHEIKTPITAVQSYLNVILQKFLGPLNEKVEEKLDRARIRSGEAIQIINNVLKISRLKLLEQVAEEELEISNIICTIFNKQRDYASSKNIELKFSDKRKVKRIIKGDPFLIDLALSNLINNAIKYIGYNGLVDVVLKEAEGGIILNISDNGVGIPGEELSKIFNDFYRASNIQKDFEGSGLGLSIVKLIVENHKGKITATSPSEIGNEKKPGTCFSISLPCI